MQKIIKSLSINVLLNINEDIYDLNPVAYFELCVVQEYIWYKEIHTVDNNDNISITIYKATKLILINSSMIESNISLSLFHIG